MGLFSTFEPKIHKTDEIKVSYIPTTHVCNWLMYTLTVSAHDAEEIATLARIDNEILPATVRCL